MTGRDLIIYILENRLEDEPIVKEGRLLGFMSLYETACKFGVGAETVKLWVELGMIDGILFRGEPIIPANVKNPIDGGANA